MFKHSNLTQIKLFTSGNSLLSGKSLSIYEDTNSWHNQFRVQVTSRIDETIFKPLFSNGTGCPNAPITVLISMMVLKEAEGLSDQKLFESCRFNILTRSAIGLLNADDPLPSESTYYLFRKKIHDYAQEKGENLFDTVFKDCTQGQSIDFEISGKRIRMDSKLLGSNIAWLSRYELVHETLRVFYKNLRKDQKLDETTKDQLSEILKFKGNKIVYTSTHSEITNKFKELGVLIHNILTSYPSQDSTLQKVFEQQFVIIETDTVLPRDKQEISAKSIQSPHDTDCHFRNKDGNKVKGYTINVTESCDDGQGLNLIGDVSVKKVSASDVDFLEQTVTSAQDVFVDQVENIHADGAYHSESNQKFCSKNNMNLHLHAIQGAKSRYILTLLENNELSVLDSKTNKLVEVTRIKSKKDIEKWRIKTEKGYRYFTQKEIDTATVRRKIEQTPIEILQKRNNVEATIFQLGYHYSNNKSRYRGIIKHQMWANMRCLWVNFVRILNFTTKVAVKTVFYQKNSLKAFSKMLILDFSRFMSLKKMKLCQFTINRKFSNA